MRARAAGGDLLCFACSRVCQLCVVRFDVRTQWIRFLSPLHALLYEARGLACAAACVHAKKHMAGDFGYAGISLGMQLQLHTYTPTSTREAQELGIAHYVWWAAPRVGGCRTGYTLNTPTFYHHVTLDKVRARVNLLLQEAPPHCLLTVLQSCILLAYFVPGSRHRCRQMVKKEGTLHSMRARATVDT